MGDDVRIWICISIDKTNADLNTVGEWSLEGIHHPVEIAEFGDSLRDYLFPNISLSKKESESTHPFERGPFWSNLTFRRRKSDTHLNKLEIIYWNI